MTSVLKPEVKHHLPQIPFAAFQRVNLGYDLLLLAELEILHPMLMLKTSDGFINLGFTSVLQTGLHARILGLL